MYMCVYIHPNNKANQPITYVLCESIDVKTSYIHIYIDIHIHTHTCNHIYTHTHIHTYQTIHRTMRAWVIEFSA